MPTLAPVRIVIAGDDQFSKKFSKVSKGMLNAGRRMQGLGTAMTTRVTAPIALMGVGIVKTAHDFEKSLNSVEAKTGASGREMAFLAKQARQLGRDTGFTAIESARGMEFMAMAGRNVNEIMAEMPHILNLAAASNTELARTADIATNIMGAFGLQSKDMPMVADVLAKTTASANVNMEMLAETMKDAAPIAETLGMGIKDVSTIAGFLGNIGIQGTKAGTALKNIMTRMAAPPKKAREWMDRLGVSGADMKGNFRGVVPIFKDLGKAMKNLSQVKRLEAINAIFGKIPLSSAAKLAGDLAKNNSEFSKLAKTMENVEGAADKMTKIMLKGSVGAFARFMGSITDLAIAIGQAGILDAIASLADGLAAILRSVSKANPALIKLVSVMGILVALAGPILMFTGIALHAFGLIGASLAAIGGVAGLVTSPFVIFLATAVGALLAITTVISNIDNSLGSVALGLLTVWNPVLGVITYLVSRFDKLMPYFKLVSNALDTSMGGLSKGPGAKALIWLSDTIVRIFDNFKNLLDFATFGGLKVLANALFTDDELVAAGLTDEGAIKGSALDRNSDLSRNNMSQSIMGPKKSEDNVTRVVFDNAPPGTSAYVEKGKQEIDFMNGPIMPGLQ